MTMTTMCVSDKPIAEETNGTAVVAPVREEEKDRAAKSKYATDLIVVLDLDETLYRPPRSEEEYLSFCRQRAEQEGEEGENRGILGVKAPSGDVLPIKLRPGVLDFLREAALSRRYEVHIFTAGHRKGVANNAIDALAKAVVGDGGGGGGDDLFAGRWFFEDCEDYLGLGMWYHKPLEKVVRASRAAAGGVVGAAGSLLTRVVLVDDRTDSYCGNRNNGIPVREYTGEDDDDDDPTFQNLLELLTALESVDDVRPVLKAMFEDTKREFL